MLLVVLCTENTTSKDKINHYIQQKDGAVHYTSTKYLLKALHAIYRFQVHIVASYCSLQASASTTDVQLFS